MAPRRPKIKPFSWSDLGLSNIQGGELADLGVSPEMMTRIVEVPILGLPELFAARDDRGHIVEPPFGGFSERLSQCFAGSPEHAADSLAQGVLPGKLLCSAHQVVELLSNLIPPSREAAVSPEWENAMEILGESSKRPRWRGMVATAMLRGYIQPLEASLLCQGHTLAATKSLEHSKQEAQQAIDGAMRRVQELVQNGVERAERLVEAARLEVQDIKIFAELDLTEVVFGKGDSWREILEEEVLRAIRFRCHMKAGKDRYQVQVDWTDRIEVVRLRDAFSWVFSPEEYDNGDEYILDRLREHLGKYTGRDALQEMEAIEEALAAALLQHRARSALDKLNAPMGHQLVLNL